MTREDELRKAIEDAGKKVDSILCGNDILQIRKVSFSWVCKRINLLEYQVAKLFQLRQADLGVRRKQEEKIGILEKRIARLEEK